MWNCPLFVPETNFPNLHRFKKKKVNFLSGSSSNSTKDDWLFTQTKVHLFSTSWLLPFTLTDGLFQEETTKWSDKTILIFSARRLPHFIWSSNKIVLFRVCSWPVLRRTVTPGPLTLCAAKRLWTKPISVRYFIPDATPVRMSISWMMLSWPSCFCRRLLNRNAMHVSKTNSLDFTS